MPGNTFTVQLTKRLVLLIPQHHMNMWEKAWTSTNFYIRLQELKKQFGTVLRGQRFIICSQEF